MAISWKAQVVCDGTNCFDEEAGTTNVGEATLVLKDYYDSTAIDIELPQNWHRRSDFDDPCYNHFCPQCSKAMNL